MSAEGGIMAPEGLLDALVRETGAEKPELKKLRDQAQASGQTFDRILISRGLDEDGVLKAFASDLGLEFRSEMEGVRVPSEFTDRIPMAFARAHDMVALAKVDDVLEIACSHPLDVHPQDDLESMLPGEIRFLLVPRHKVAEILNRAYRHKADGVDIQGVGTGNL